MAITENEILNGLSNAVDNSVPDIIGKILSECSNGRTKKDMNDQKNTIEKCAVKSKNYAHNGILKRIIAIAAAFVLIVSGVFVYGEFNKVSAAASTIELDVNPSIEINVSSDNKIISVIAKNADAEKILEGLDFEGATVDVAIYAIIGSLVEHGYINELHNSILVTVDNGDEGQRDAIEKHVVETIDSVLKSNSVEGAIIAQSACGNQTAKNAASQYGISVGKATFISNIIAKNPDLDFETLSTLSIHELNLLIQPSEEETDETGEIEKTEEPEETDDMYSLGTPSELSYIGAGNARKIAMENAGIDRQNDLDSFSAKLNCNDGKIVYNVKLIYNGTKYEYEIDALNGEILNSINSPAEDEQNNGNGNNGKSNNGNKNNDQTVPATGFENEKNNNGNGNGNGKQNSEDNKKELIDIEQAKAIAFEKAGIDSSADIDLKTDFNTENGVSRYEISFIYDGIEYDITVNAISGAVIKFRHEYCENKDTNAIATETEEKNNNGKDNSNGNNGNKNSNETALVTGSENEKNNNGKGNENSENEQSGKYIDIELAKNIAFKMAGILSETDTECSVNVCDETGACRRYELKFTANGCDYCVTVNAITGSVVKFDKKDNGNPSSTGSENDNISENNGNGNGNGKGKGN
ncbi:MAG: PepSY domain-containing protein [Oscillospiraceae bacterium]|nr:PepSY domain-containing protein [Oscillospiraceae bacterium]